MPLPFFPSLSRPQGYAIAIVFGLIIGYGEITPFTHWAQIITDNFIKIFKCISLPIIALSILVTLSGFQDNPHIQTIWKKTLLYTATTTVIAASVACVLYGIIAPPNLQIPGSSHIPGGMETARYFDSLSSLIPTDIFTPFIEHQVMGVLCISIVMGLAIGCIPEDHARHTVRNFFMGIHSLWMVITGWIVAMMPVALFGFITTTVVQLQQGADLGGLTQYLLVVVLANGVQGLIILPVFLALHHIKPFAAMRSMLPALTVAFFSKSSAGTLPITIDTIEKKLQVAPATSRLVLPLCTSINMNGCAAFIFVTVIYGMQNHGITIDYATMGIWIGIATIAAIGNAGVPMGCFFLSASLLSSMQIPIEIMGLIAPFYALIDMVETALNVWSDACVTMAIDRAIPQPATPQPV